MVTATQVQSALPYYEAITMATDAISKLTTASGTNSILGFVVTLGDQNLEGNGQIIVSIPLNPTQAAPLFQAMISQLTALQGQAQTAMGAI